MKIQKELDETKIVLHKTIESVLERGEKIDTLVSKSNDLSSQSKVCFILLSVARCTHHFTGILHASKEAEQLLCNNVGHPACY